MPAVEVNGGVVEYDFLGDAGAPVIVVTPGGRFSKDVPGVRRFGEALAEGGYRGAANADIMSGGKRPCLC